MTQVFKHIGALLAAGSAVLAFAPSASALDVSFSPDQFSNFEGLVDDVTNPLAPNTINTNTATDVDGNRDGFNNFFNDPFLLLGANPGDTGIFSDSLTDDDSTAFSPTFSIADGNITGRISVSYNFAFFGNSAGSGFDDDDFSIFLQNTTTFANVFVDGLEAPNFASGTRSVLLDSSDFAAVGASAGDYRLLIALNENGFNTNSTAVGFNEISVTAVPFEFSPALGLLAVGGLFGGSSVLKRRKAANKVDLK